MLQFFGILSGVVTAVAYIPYIKDILKLSTKPQRVTWLIYAVLGSIAFFSQLAKGASNSLWLPGLETIATILTFILSIRFGVGGFSRDDVIALVMATLGLVAWYFTQDAAIALYLVILVDAVGTWPTVVKAYQDPKSETLSTWLLVTMGGILAMLAVGHLSFVLLIYPFYIFAANAVVVVAIKVGEHKLLNVRSKTQS